MVRRCLQGAVPARRRATRGGGPKPQHQVRGVVPVSDFLTAPAQNACAEIAFDPRRSVLRSPAPLLQRGLGFCVEIIQSQWAAGIGESPTPAAPVAGQVAVAVVGLCHFWGSELLYVPPEPGQEYRHNDLLDPVWNMFDLAPEGGARVPLSPQLRRAGLGRLGFSPETSALFPPAAPSAIWAAGLRHGRSATRANAQRTALDQDP